MPDKTAKSPRQQLAERIAKYIRKQKWTAPFGGDVHKDRNAYGILFSKPATLDGLVRVYSPTFIVIQCQGRASHGNWMQVYESEEAALRFLKLAFELHQWDDATAVPYRQHIKTKVEVVE